MFNLLSLAIGAVAIIPMLIAMVPFLGWINWLVLLMTATGLFIGSISSGNAGRNLNLIVLVVAVVRLALGHGFI
jgi:hypothetical protein